jgi:hypothetical protein
MSSGTFAAFPKIHLNTSKFTFMKVVHLVEGHNFHVDWHFKFLVESGEKLDRLTVPPCFLEQADIQCWHDVPAKSVEKNTIWSF